MVRQFLYTDSIIGSVRNLVQDYASELDLSDQHDADALTAFVCAVSDVLERIGITGEGIRLALGEYADWVDDRRSDPLPCYICGDPAQGLASMHDEWRLVCIKHGHMTPMEAQRI